MTCDRLDNPRSEMPKIQEELALHVVDTSFKERKAKGKNVGKFRPTDENDIEQLQLLETQNKNNE